MSIKKTSSFKLSGAIKRLIAMTPNRANVKRIWVDAQAATQYLPRINSGNRPVDTINGSAD
jgi:hypothetical protein